MQEVMDTQLCYAVLRGKSKEQLFEEEIQKMKLLNVAAYVRKGMDINVLAYCVLDNELHLILRLKDGQSAGDFLDSIARRYEEVCLPAPALRVDYLPGQTRFPDVNSSVNEQGFFYDTEKKIQHFRKSTVRVLKGAGAALRGCLKLHMLPVRQGIVADPEDYWWCSYLDYMGRQWLPVADTSEVLSGFAGSPRQVEKSIRQYHRRELEKIVSTE